MKFNILVTRSDSLWCEYAEIRMLSMFPTRFQNVTFCQSSRAYSKSHIIRALVTCKTTGGWDEHCRSQESKAMLLIPGSEGGLFFFTLQG